MPNTSPPTDASFDSGYGLPVPSPLLKLVLVVVVILHVFTIALLKVFGAPEK